MITSRRNPLVRRLKALVTRRGREEQQLLLLEGTHLLQEALSCRQLSGQIASAPALELVATREWLDRHPELLDRLPAETVLHQVSPEVLSAALTTVNPDGVATLLPLAALPPPVSGATLLLALDRLQDPGNLGSLFRSSLAAGVDGLWMASGADPLAPKVLRSSAGSVLHLPYQRFGPSEQDGVAQLAAKLQEAAIQGMQVVATLVPDAAGIDATPPYWELDWRQPTVLVLGNEGAGIHPSLQACCTHGVTLPHSPAVESLNVAAAAVPLLLERRRVKMTAPLQQSG
ncbi:MAG: TrmH family RNA methyltransferase [Prochlorococcus sp.]